MNQILAALLRVRDAAVSVVVTILNKISDEPLVTIAAIQVAVESATDQSAQGYILAALVALGRFAVAPVLPRIGE